MVHSGSGMANRIWALGFLAMILVHCGWQACHNAPPAWDMAHHQIMGWTLLNAAREGRLAEALVHASDYYPPFYYSLEALVLDLAGDTRWLALLVNLPGLLLLSWCTFRLTQAVTGSAWAPAAGWMALAAPLTAWTSRESLLDPWLSGWVVLSYYLLVLSKNLTERRWTLWLAIAVAGGMLTKWSFALFVLPPVLWLWWRSGDRRKSSLNLLDLALVSGPAMLWWYLPNARSLFQRLQLTAAGADWEMDPQLDSLLGWIYYPRSLSSYYLFLPLTLILAAGIARWCIRGFRRRENPQPVPEPGRHSPGSARQVIVAGLMGGIALLTLLKAKDPRYVMPLAAPVFILLVDLWRDRPRVLAGAAVLAGLQFLLVTVPVPWIPQRIGFFAIPGDQAYHSMRQEWVWFETSYFGVTGPPRREDWRVGELLAALPPGARVGFVPDAASFHPGLLRLEALRRNRPVHVIRLGLSDDWPAQLGKVDWVIGKSGDQGISFITQFNQDVYGALEQLRWPQVSSWELPDESRVQLWRSPSQSP